MQFGPTQADYSTVVQWARSKGLVGYDDGICDGGWGSPIGWNLIYKLAGVTQTQSPSLNQTETNGPATCGNALAGYHNACWIELTVTATVASGQTLYVNGQQENSGYTFTETEDWGTGSCQNTPDGNLCFGWATFPGQTFYATQTGYGNSEQVKSD